MTVPRRATLILPLLVLGALAPASADAAFVTAVDVAVRPAEGSPWSKGTLFQGEGFQVGATTSNGWAWGRAKGGAERCGWVLISEINSTTRTDTTCGAPSSEPLGDSEHVPGGGPSERWYVICDSATLHGNYGGGPGQLRNEAGTVTKGTALGWRYTTGDNYAASVDGPTGTPRFLLRSCISRTPPMGPPAPGPGPTPAPGPAPGAPEPDDEGDNPPAFDLLDSELIAELRVSASSGSLRAAAASPPARGAAKARGAIRIRFPRATIRLARGNLVVANALRGDKFSPRGSHCFTSRTRRARKVWWYFGDVRRGKRNLTGWVQGTGLSHLPSGTSKACGRTLAVGPHIGATNAPFRSITYRASKKAWRSTGSPTQAVLKTEGKRLAAGCDLYMNYNGNSPADEITPTLAEKLFEKNDENDYLRTARGTIGYRYTTPNGRFALVSIPTGRTERVKGRTKPKPTGLWAFVRRGCVLPKSARDPNSRFRRIYFTSIRVCAKVSRDIKKMDGPNDESPCRRVARAKNPDDGWRPGSLSP